ncbi:MAG: 16S rRNA (cytidine(1402)-2'-O)-methyltransferase, partial [Polynucleobacter sp.]|nr:16S rRNA (cytidine(1402)-2'-O)-methyltransferase [Polynucleobacter sp.]
RALHVLNLVDGIACEDTRHSAPLLQHFGIHKKCIALHAHNEANASQTVIEHLRHGERWAYISDAGTPGISDPGARLAHEVVLAGFRVLPIPGVSAVASAVSVAGSTLLPSEGRFQFWGFWPHKSKERDAWINRIGDAVNATVFFESPHQIASTLLMLSASLDDGRLIMVGRELTKKFEQVVYLKPSAVPNWLTSNESLKGEFVVMVSGRQRLPNESLDRAELIRWVNALKPLLGSKDIAAVIAAITGIPKKEAYLLALEGK